MNWGNFDSAIPSGFRSRRRRAVTEQYNNDHAASQYIRSHTTEHPVGRHLVARVRLVARMVSGMPGGLLLDAGCGPGVLAQTLLRSPGHDFSITVLDQSPDMVEHCLENAGQDALPGKSLRGAVGDLLALPFPDGMFDVALATGALEYTSKYEAIAELSRVTRKGGTVIVSMLNPLNPYRFAEWFAYWPALRVLSLTLNTLRIRSRRPHDAEISGIRAVPSGVLRRHMRTAGLRPRDLIYFDLSLVVPPLDRIPRVRRWAEHHSPLSRTARRMRRWMGRGYILVAERDLQALTAVRQALGPPPCAQALIQTGTAC